MGASIVNQSNDIIPVVIKAGIDSTVKLDNRELVFVVGIKKAEPPQKLRPMISNIHPLLGQRQLLGRVAARGTAGIDTTAFS